MAGSFVYVISGNHGRQKIGVSDDPGQRIRDLQTGSPFKLHFEFVGLTDGTAYDIEGEAHFLLHEHRAEGEWFVVPPEVAITAVMASARRLNHTIRPVDPDHLPALPQLAVAGRSAATWWLRMAGFFVILACTDSFLIALVGSFLAVAVLQLAGDAIAKFRPASIGLVLLLAAHVVGAKAAEVRCDSPGVAQMLVPDLIAHNPSAEKLGIEVKSVRLVGVEGDKCIVWVETNRDIAIKYRFGFDHGQAALDMIDLITR